MIFSSEMPGGDAGSAIHGKANAAAAIEIASNGVFMFFRLTEALYISVKSRVLIDNGFGRPLRARIFRGLAVFWTPRFRRPSGALPALLVVS
jgi:hypothetical protein